MAYQLKVNGEKSELADTKLETLQKAVGGYIEMVETKDGDIMVINEEGKIENLPVNPFATELYKYGSDDPIMGDVVIAKRNEIE